MMSVSLCKFVLNVKYATEVRFGAGVGIWKSPLDSLIEGVHMPLFNYSGKHDNNKRCQEIERQANQKSKRTNNNWATKLMGRQTENS